MKKQHPQGELFSKAKPDYLKKFDPTKFEVGHHVFSDGCCEPNPGSGGWGIVAICNGAEIFSDHGGEPDTTNNRMELLALLKAIGWARQYPTLPILVWSDSQYAVKGSNDWRHNWKAKGWKRAGDNATPKNQSLANADLWMAIDEALSGPRAANISVHWIKGHAGLIWNERADELAGMGVAQICADPVEDLDREYRAIMAD